jgi:uncharacterized protein (DUF58 family)
MKQAAFFITAFFTYYLAGMYRSLPMIVLCVMELLLYAMLFLLSRYFKRNLSAEFFKRGDSAEKSTELPCGVRVRNRGKLPAGRLEVCLRLTCGQDLEYEKKLCGGGEPGGVLWFGVLSPYCGLLRIQMNRIRVYDYLSLFSAGKPADDKMTIAVFPKERALRITFRAFGRSGDSSGEDQTARRIGDAHSEIRQIREYRAGDSNRHIHWNQSVRTDMLWTKEYETETDAPADVFLDAGGLREASAENAGAF